MKGERVLLSHGGLVRWSSAIACLLFVAAHGAAPAAAQRPVASDSPPGPEAWIGGMVYGLEAGYAQGLSPDVLVGAQVGLLPQIGITLAPEPDGEAEPELSEWVHVAAFVRVRSRPAWELDMGVRTGLGDLWPCTASDCLPVWFRSLYVQPMAGWERLKIGVRLSAGWVAETRTSSRGDTFVVVLHPLLFRWTFPL